MGQEAYRNLLYLNNVLKFGDDCLTACTHEKDDKRRRFHAHYE
jgi:hypothetical protein